MYHLLLGIFAKLRNSEVYFEILGHRELFMQSRLCSIKNTRHAQRQIQPLQSAIERLPCR